MKKIATALALGAGLMGGVAAAQEVTFKIQVCFFME